MGRKIVWSKDNINLAIQILNEREGEGLINSFKIIGDKIGISPNSVSTAYYTKGSLLRESINELLANKKDHYYTNDEIEICLSLIKKHPDNLQHAFRLASEKTGRSAKSISSSWYDNKKTLSKYKKKKSIFSLVSFFGFFKSNLKNNLAKGKSSL